MTLPILGITMTLLATSPDRGAKLARALQELGLDPEDVAVKLTDLNTFDHQPKRLRSIARAIDLAGDGA